MANKKPKKSPTALSMTEFLGQFWDDVEKAFALEERLGKPAAGSLSQLFDERFLDQVFFGGDYSPELWNTVRDWWPFCVLRLASEKGDAEGYKRLLDFFLWKLKAPAPEGVFTPFRWPRGRPRETAAVHAEWIAKERPQLTWQVKEDLARACYPAEFRKAKLAKPAESAKLNIRWLVAEKPIQTNANAKKTGKNCSRPKRMTHL